MNNPDVLDTLELWVAERQLSRRKLAFLETVHTQTIECIVFGNAYAPQIAGQALASDLDLPYAPYICQLVADLLDFLKPLPNGGKHARLIGVTDALVGCGHLDAEEAEKLYEDL